MPNFNKIARFIEYLLGIGALLGVLIFLQLNMSTELYDPDIWLHLKTGEYILAHKAIPQLDTYSAPNLGKPWVDHSPLAQIAYHWAFNSGGADRLIYFSCIIMLLAFLLLFCCIYKDRSALPLSVIALALTIFASRIRFNIRPENFSVLFFCAYLFILTRYKNKKLIFILPLLQLIWVNCHGFFILGLLLIALFLIGEGLKLLKKLPWEWSNSDPIDKKGFRNLISVFLLSALACLINPNGITGALYPLTIIFNSITHPSVMHNRIVELLPPWSLGYNKVFAYYLLLAVSLLSFLFNFRKINFTLLLFWLALLGISFNINRNIIFFNCIACIACVDNFAQAASRPISAKTFRDNFIFFIQYLALAVIIWFAAAGNLNMLNDRYYLFDQDRMKSSLLGISNVYPEKAADFISKNGLADNLFNIFNHGSYLIYRLYPQNHVFIDGRTELYDNQYCQDYLRILYTATLTTGKLLDKYNVNTILLSGNLLDIEKLTAYLYQNNEWALVYLNDDGLIFIRQTMQNGDLIEKLRVDLNKWEIKKADLKKIGLRRVDPSAYTRLAQILFSLGADQKARLQAKEALSILPSSAEAYAILGRIYLRNGSPDQAYQFLRLAAIYAPGNLSTLIALSDYYLKIGDNENTEKTYKRIIKLFPRYAQGDYLLGIYYENSGDLKNAAQYLRKAIALAPYSTIYQNKLKEVAAKIPHI